MSHETICYNNFSSSSCFKTYNVVLVFQRFLHGPNELQHVGDMAYINKTKRHCCSSNRALSCHNVN
ncbi:hypothetical protein CIPAW_05G106500 [Carya illinoinensis]|uniref:Uncharacterized protein n=1 Tax=Carya illinoinensis TaxID=32201 RepID=A0A8T1QI35_CARIL|nr:hypothetical protein CIPAW_05G106500 [Carya illinoinensis]